MDVESAFTVIVDDRKLIKKGNIRLHILVSNSSEVMKSIPDLYEDYIE